MWLTLLIQLIPTLVKIAEEVFAKVPKSGEQKREFVLGVVDGLVYVADTTFTGGARETWEQIKPRVGTVVDATANILFPRHPAGGAFGDN